jgi:hypothetical protein
MNTRIALLLAIATAVCAPNLGCASATNGDTAQVRPDPPPKPLPAPLPTPAPRPGPTNTGDPAPRPPPG